MRKKISIFLFLFMVTLCGLFGCTKDPYANLKVTTSVSEIHSYIESRGNGNYDYNDISFDITVSGAEKNVSTDVTVKGWEGYLETPTYEVNGNVTTFHSRPRSENHTGSFKLQILAEGNKSAQVDVTIDLKLNGFTLKKDKLQAVAIEKEILLDEKLVNYSPANTTQKKINFSLVVPTLSNGIGVMDDRVDGNTTFLLDGYDNDLIQKVFVEKEYKYGEVYTDPQSGKQILRIFKYLHDQSGNIVYDSDHAPILARFPKIQKETTGTSEVISYDAITLRAESAYGDQSIPRQYVDMEVVAGAGEAKLSMNLQASDDMFEINRNSSGEYDVVLIDPKFEKGLLSPSEMSYFIERQIMFTVPDIVDEQKLSEYEVVTTDVSSDSDLPVDISTIDNGFRIHALKAGDYTHTFTVRHKNYPGVFDTEIKINFHVISIPFNITINGNEVSTSGNDSVTTIYNTYGSSSYGTKFSVNTQSNFGYFVFMNESDTAKYGQKVSIRRDGDGSYGVMGYRTTGDGGIDTIAPVTEGASYSTFGNVSNFFMLHNLDDLPKEPATFYVGILFSMAHSSYDDTVAEMFSSTLLSFPFKVQFENGISKIDLTKSSYQINLNNKQHLFKGADQDATEAIKLWELPKGQTYAKAIESITYDKNLINVFYVYDDDTDKTTLYLKYVEGATEGKTTVQIRTLNGLTKSVNVSTYYSSIYEFGPAGGVDREEGMPLATTIDLYSPGYLYHMQGEKQTHEDGYDLYINRDSNDFVTRYDSVSSLFMIVNASVNLTFLDYRIVEDDEGLQYAIPIDITNKVSVRFNYSNYVRYSNGTLYSQSLVTTDKNSPIIMTVIYNTAYEAIDEFGEFVYTPIEVRHSIKIYIYDPLEGVEILSSKSVDLYLEDSLGYYDKDNSTHTIVSTFIPNQINLGSQWNGSEDWALEWDPVELKFVYADMYNMTIIKSNGDPVVIYATETNSEGVTTTVQREIKYSDIFEVTVNPNMYECTVVSKLSSDLKEWLEGHGFNNEEAIKKELESSVYSNNIEFVVNIQINQFNRLQNINSVRFYAKYAERIGELNLDIDDDGVYFALKKVNGQLVADKERVVINYTIDNVNAINKDIILESYATTIFYAEIEQDPMGNSGRIIVYPRTTAGISQLVATPEDNIEGLKEDGKNEYYIDSIVQSLRVKVADGSKDYPFEVREMSDFMDMVNQIKAGNYYYYVITRNLNFSGYNIDNINIPNIDSQIFSLSGKHEYVRNGQQITTYSSIYNLTIQRSNINNVSDGRTDINAGLFDSIDSCVILDNIYVENARVIIIDNTTSAVNINVGILVGKSQGATITSCKTTGTITITKNNANSNLVVGGMVGRLSNSNLSELPGQYEYGVVSTGNNGYVDIELNTTQTTEEGISALNAENLVVGGLVGLSSTSTIKNIQVISTITTTVRAVIGGLIGKIDAESGSGNTTVSGIDISPTLVAKLDTVSQNSQNGLILGGVVGQAKTGYDINNVIVSFVDVGSDNNYTWQQRANIYVYAPKETVCVSGIIGLDDSSSSKLFYSYVRSYYENDFTEDNQSWYKGNIFVVANNGSVGGLIGKITGSTTIQSSYFDGDISASTGINFGLVVGTLSNNTTINYAYGIGFVSVVTVQEDSTIKLDIESEKVSSNGIFGGLTFSESEPSVGGLPGSAYVENAGTLATLKNVYGVINAKVHYAGEQSDVFGVKVDDIDTALGGTTENGFVTFLQTFLQYKITLGEDQDLASYQWFYHKDVNTVKVNDQTHAYPVLLNGDKVMYDLVPTAITTKVNEREGLYDITYEETSQVIMYLNRTADGRNSGTYYEMSLDKENSAFYLTLDGAKISTTYVNASNLKMNDKIEFLEDSNEGIIRISGNKVYPVSVGVATLTIRSYVVKSVKLDIQVVVVDGITDFDLYNGSSEKLTPKEKGSLVDSKPNKIFIDEQSEHRLQTTNFGGQYLANTNVGYIVEILDATNNAVVSIDGKEYTFDSVSEQKNVYKFDKNTFNIFGVKLGFFDVKITPFIILPSGVSYKDTYKCSDGSTKEFDNIYLLDGIIDGKNVSYDLSKVYNFEVLARARGIDTNKSRIELDSRNIVDFAITIETANVIIGDETDGVAQVTILEDMLLSISNGRFSAWYELDKNYQFDVKKVGDDIQSYKYSYVYTNESDERIKFDYTLLNIIFENITIIPTIVDPQSRNNTYMITIQGKVNFDVEYYRMNADMFDLNNVAFVMTFSPYSEANLKTTVNVKIVAKDIATIFTNFYTHGELHSGLLGNKNQPIDYPEENESTFIVPNRSGLLKITFDEEFNSSSYVTVTLDKRYLGYVTVDQLSAIVDNPASSSELDVGDILGYNNVTTYVSAETENTFGVRLSKLSLNYRDQNYFNNTYYVRLFADPSIDFETVDLTITAYKTDENGRDSVQISKVVSLQVYELPSIKVTLDGDDFSVMGKGVRKPLEINYKGITKDIDFSITATRNAQTADNNLQYLQIVDNSGTSVGKLSLEYLQAGNTYYLAQNVLMPAGLSYSIRFNVNEIILGVLEQAECQLDIDTVEYEIEDILVMGETSDRLTLLHGSKTHIDVKIDYKDVVVGRANDITAFENTLNDPFGNLARAELGMTGIRVSNGVDKFTSSSKLYLYYFDRSSVEPTYSDFILGSAFGAVTVNEIQLNYYKPTQHLKNGEALPRYNDYTTILYEMKATSIRDDTYVKFNIEYYYDSNGVLNLGSQVFGSTYQYIYTFTKDMQIVVEDNSTYDHPIPIENQEDLIKYSSVEGGKFILLNNIVLKDWTPIPAMFESLDGNGYVLSIESFNLSSFQGTDTADVGIFTTTSTETLLQNITVDVSKMLKTKTRMQNDIQAMRSSTSTTYRYTSDKIDLGYIKNLNFGILVGVNNGAITNAKIVNISTKVYNEDGEYFLHILTTHGYQDGDLMTANIGGIAGKNSETGAITNSFVGLNYSDYTPVSNLSWNSWSYVKIVNNPSPVEYNNSTDELESVRVCPFVLAGGNYLAGIASINDGIISNTYNLGMGLYNTYPSVGMSATAGLVTFNNNVITSTFVEGAEHEVDKDGNLGVRARDNKFRIESTSYIGGVVYDNNGTIENSYNNAFLKTESSYLGGFVYINEAEGQIINCYSTAVNRNSLAIGQFTGVKSGILQNFGTYTNCYYLVLDGGEAQELPNAKEIAEPIVDSENSVSEKSSYNGFAFVTGSNNDGIWQISDGSIPYIQASKTDTNSFRRLEDINVIPGQDETEIEYYYNYDYQIYYLGTEENPIVVHREENFDLFIIDNASLIEPNNRENTDRIFGSRQSDSAVRFVRLVNNLDFENITTAREHKNTYLYHTTFVGVLDGNGMTMSNLNIITDSTGLQNFGLFAKIGDENDTNKAVVKNLNLGVRTYKSNGNRNAGVLAGTIVNSSIVNVKIDGGGQTVSGLNSAGALAGLIYSSQKQSGDQTSYVSPVTLIDIIVENIRVESTYSSLPGAITAQSVDKSNYFFNKFTVEREGTQTQDGYSFASLYDVGKKVTNIDNFLALKGDENGQVSYSGGVAGILLAGNYTEKITEKKDGTGTVKGISDYRVTESTIDNIIVRGNITISTADTAGGLFGYIGEDTVVRNSKFVISDNQLLKAFNSIGGIVGELHGVVEQCSVAYSDADQKELDQSILIDNERTNGTYYLFDMNEGEPYYTVSIGGIAGYSENGVIIDSYTRANVTKPLSYIVGGVVGYAKNYNYLGSVYSTGAVYGNNVIGGVIGLQVVDGSFNSGSLSLGANRLHMQNVIALTNWTATEGDDGNNFRDLIATKLYNNEKLLYADSTSGSYKQFYIKLPEIGNAPINVSNNSTLTANYRVGHSTYYIGSVVGKSLIANSNGQIINAKNSSSSTTDHVFVDSDLINTIYHNTTNDTTTENVFSTTLGYMSTEGSEKAGDRVDTYFNTTFDVNASDATFTSTSFRVAYQNTTSNVDESKTNPLLNYYDLSSAENSGYSDIFTFNKVFTAQEYIQQILGQSYSLYIYKPSSDDEGDEIYSLKSATKTMSIFANGWQAQRSSAYPSTAFVQPSDNFWSIDDYLPKFSTKIKKTIIEVTSDTTLGNAFKAGLSGKTYVIKNDIPLSYDGSNLNVENYATVSSIFMGQNKPTITMNLSSRDTVSLFRLLSGAVLQNINFVIKVSKSTPQSHVDEVDYGLLADTLDGVYISDCSFSIELSHNFRFENNDGFNASNVGVLFGSIKNSTISNSSFVVKTSSVSINDAGISNFGLIAGSISNSNFENVKFGFSADVAINVARSATTLNIGGIAGNTSNLTLNNCSFNNSDTSITVNDTRNVKSSLNLGTLFGYSRTLLISVSNGKTSDINDILTLNSNSSQIESINVGAVTGASNNSKINSIIVNGGISVSSSLTGVYLSTLNVGSVIGLDEQSSQIGRSGIVISKSVLSVELNAMAVNVGGIVGQTRSSSALVSKTIFDGSITVTNEATGNVTSKIDKSGTTYTINYATTFVGGILGYASGSVGLSSIVSDGTISVKFASGITNTGNTDSLKPIRTGIGGIIGGAVSSTEVTDFSALATFGEIVGSSAQTASYRETTFELVSNYISGVLGYNSGIFVGKNGYSYTELATNNSKFIDLSTIATTSAITSGTIGTASENVYYAQEFVGSNYYGDTNFATFAIGDIVKVYGSASKYSDFVDTFSTKMTEYSKFDINARNVELYMPFSVDDNITLKCNNSGSNGTSKFNVSTTNSSARFYAITSDGTNTIPSIPLGQYVSGRSTPNGKTTITLTTGTNLVGTNSGVLSNVYLYLKESTMSGQYPSACLVDTNSGLITHCYVYGITTNESPIARSNYGKIYSCGSAVKTQVSNTSTLYGLVGTNNESGIIRDCYSSSFGYVTNHSFSISVYGFAKTNNGLIEYSTYWIPADVEAENLNKGFIKETSDETSSGTMNNCYNSSLPPLTSRENVWEVKDNGEIGLVGIDETRSAITTWILFNGTRVKTVSDLIEKIKSKNGDSDSYKLSYELDFYGKDTPEYKVVKITSGAGLSSYINSLPNNYIPRNTIVMLTNNYVEKSNKIEISSTINAGINLNAINLNQNSALIGVNTVTLESVAGIEMKDEAGKNLTQNEVYNKIYNSGRITLDFGENTLPHEFVNSNSGLIAGIELANVTLSDRTAIGSTTSFAPIKINACVIDNFFLTKVAVSTYHAYVAGMINNNKPNAFLLSGGYEGLDLSSGRNYYYNRICNTNDGTININKIHQGNLVTNGNLGKDGV